MIGRTLPGGGAFRSLRIYNYRIWAGGAVVSNVGTWMQRIAQDWLVLTVLTHRSATAVGIVMALQFGPQVLFLPWIGFAADHFDRRKLVMTTQAVMGGLSLLLGAMTIAGVIQLWEVYVFAALAGTAAAFDAPARQTFVSNLVGDEDLANAVALNSTSFNAARMIGPAVAGLCIATWGTGWAFIVNGGSFLAVLLSLTLIRRDELHVSPRTTTRMRGSLGEGIRYIRERAELRAMMTMLFLVGAFGLNFPIFISTMAVTVFGMGAGRYGLLTSSMAVGTTLGALLLAGGERPTFRRLVGSSALFGLGLGLAALMPSYWAFAAILMPLGVATMTFSNTSSSLIQLATEPAMRGRVVAIRLAMISGSSVVGGPIIGLVADRFGPRWALGFGALAAMIAALAGQRSLRNSARLASAATAPIQPSEDDIHLA